MKRISFVVVAVLCLGRLAAAYGADTVPLPAPDKSGGVTLAQALSERRTSRDFADADLTQQQLSDLLWSTAGVNRADGKTVYAVSMNRHDMTVYAVTRQGAYRYDPAAHALVLVAAGDHRAKTGTQPYVGGAAVNLAYVQDMSFWQDKPDQPARGRDWGFAHTGEMAQNAYLFAAGQGWAAAVRGLFDQDVMKDLLQLSDGQFVRLVHSIGPMEGGK